MNNTTPTEWERNFDKLNIHYQECVTDMPLCHCNPKKEVVGENMVIIHRSYGDDIKDFIRSTLRAERQKLRDNIEGIKDDYAGDSNDFNNGLQAMKGDVLSLLQD